MCQRPIAVNVLPFFSDGVSLYVIALVDMLNPLNPDSLRCGHWSLLAHHWSLMLVLKLAVDMTLAGYGVESLLVIKVVLLRTEISPQTF